MSLPLKYYVEKISHFLEGHKIRKDMTLVDLGEETRISEASLSRIINKKKEIKLEDLYALSNIEHESLANFFLYLEDKQIICKNPPNVHIPWYDDLLSIFADLKPKLRNSFIGQIFNKRSKEEYEALFKLFLKISYLKQNQLNFIEQYINQVTKGDTIEND